MQLHAKLAFTSLARRQRGFSLVETMIATAMFLVGLIAIAELVPTTLLLNLTNRNDTAALGYAQRELSQMLDQPLNFASFPDADGNFCQLGAAIPNTVVGSPIIMDGRFVRVNFLAAQVPGYSFNYIDPNDPRRTQYDVRWAVVTTTSGGLPIAKRFIVGAWRRGGNNYAPPVTLDAVVQK